MNRRERIMATLRGEPVDRPAVNFYEVGGFNVDPDDPDPFNIYNSPDWKPLIQLAEEKSDIIRMRNPVRARSHTSWRMTSNQDSGEFFKTETYLEDGCRMQHTTVTIGGAYQTQSAWGFNLELLYRNAERDQRNSVVIPNTGGEWLDVIPAIQYHISETLALKAAAKIPVSRDLHDELQFTTKYAFRVSLSYVFGGI